jgi:hypothetical protein
MLDTPEERRRAVRLATCVTGIVASLLVYGVLQERIMTQVRTTSPWAAAAAAPTRIGRRPHLRFGTFFT